MLWGEEKRLCVLYALTPVHAGSGQALKAVDLPIQRERHTAWPTVQASGIKGALRDWCEKAWKNDNLVEEIFGKAGESGSNWAGALTFTDARILLFPVRSNVSPFVHVTSPAVLKRLREDASVAGMKLPDVTTAPDEDKFVVLKGNLPEKVILEDVLVHKSAGDVEAWTKYFDDLTPEAQHVILVSEAVFNYLVRTATEVQAHIAIDDATGTTKEGSLRYQEYLPSDSVLYFLAFFDKVRVDNSKMDAKDVAKKVCEEGVSSHIQIGGDFTLGKGICKVRWYGDKRS